HVALVAVAEENGRAMIIAGARYIVVEPRQAEVAFTVLDDYQRQGVGAALLRHLIGIARGAGIGELIAQVLPDNTAMLKVFERSGAKYTAKRQSQTIDTKLELSGGWQQRDVSSCAEISARGCFAVRIGAKLS